MHPLVAILYQLCRQVALDKTIDVVKEVVSGGGPVPKSHIKFINELQQATSHEQRRRLIASRVIALISNHAVAGQLANKAGKQHLDASQIATLREALALMENGGSNAALAALSAKVQLETRKSIWKKIPFGLKKNASLLKVIRWSVKAKNINAAADTVLDLKASNNALAVAIVTTMQEAQSGNFELKEDMFLTIKGLITGAIASSALDPNQAWFSAAAQIFLEDLQTEDDSTRYAMQDVLKKMGTPPHTRTTVKVLPFFDSSLNKPVI